MMVKTISKMGNSCGIIFDGPLLELAHLKKGDQVNIEVHEGGVITLTPVKGRIKPAKAPKTAARLIRKNSGLFQRLA